MRMFFDMHVLLRGANYPTPHPELMWLFLMDLGHENLDFADHMILAFSSKCRPKVNTPTQPTFYSDIS